MFPAGSQPELLIVSLARVRRGSIVESGLASREQWSESLRHHRDASHDLIAGDR